MPTGKRPDPRTFIAFFLMLFSLTAMAEEPERKAMIIRFNNISSTEYGQCANCVGVIEGIASYLQGKAKQQESVAIHKKVKNDIPDLNAVEKIIDSMKCLQYTAEKETCYEIFLVESDQKMDDEFFNKIGKHGQESVSIAIDIRFERKMLQIDYSFGEATVAGGQIARQFAFSYRQKAPGELTASPFPQKKGAKLTSAQQASADYWLNSSAGEPPLEVALINSLIEFHAVIGMIYSAIGPPEAGFTSTDFYKNLPQLAELKQQGKYNCLGNECKQPYLRCQNERMWYLPSTTFQIAYVLSVPTK